MFFYNNKSIERFGQPLIELTKTQKQKLLENLIPIELYQAYNIPKKVPLPPKEIIDLPFPDDL